jgi:hypothetical protein
VKRAFLVLGVALETFCSMRGLKIDVQNSQQYIYIAVV